MPLHVGAEQIKDLYWGKDRVRRVYSGNVLVHQITESITSGVLTETSHTFPASQTSEFVPVDFNFFSTVVLRITIPKITGASVVASLKGYVSFSSPSDPGTLIPVEFTCEGSAAQTATRFIELVVPAEIEPENGIVNINNFYLEHTNLAYNVNNSITTLLWVRS